MGWIDYLLLLPLSWIRTSRFYPRFVLDKRRGIFFHYELGFKVSKEECSFFFFSFASFSQQEKNKNSTKPAPSFNANNHF